MKKRIRLISIIYIMVIGLALVAPLFTVKVSAEESSEIPNVLEDPEAYHAYLKSKRN